MRRAKLTLLALALLALALVAAPGAASAASTASFTFPLNGATNVDTGKPFTWTNVGGAQAYYLYVGTSQGAKDLVDSAALTTTSYSVPPLPTGRTLWARIWTQSNNAWTFQDISFTAAAITTARFINPVDGTQGVDPAQPFAWYAVPNAQAYTLSVGTSKGASDLVSTGEISATSYQVPRLPTGQTLWARIWTKLNGTWRFQDSSFTASLPSRATFTYPQSGATNVNTSKDFTWAPVQTADAYYLYVGTSQGASDLVNSGATSATSYKLPPLPLGQTLWGRVWTLTNGVWSYSDVSFQVAISASRMTYPQQDQTDVDTRTPFKWSAAPGAQAYYLWVGTSPGTSDLVNSGETQATSWDVPALPVGQTLYARIYTKINGAWNTYTSVSFKTAYSAAKLTYPSKAGSVNLDMSKPLSWTPIPGADGYAVWIGSSPGGSDVAQSDVLSQPSWSPDNLPAGGKLWARVWTLSSGTWVYSADVPFTPGAQIKAPAQRSTSVDRTRPVTWSPGAVVNGAQPHYRLLIGSSPSGRDLFDSGDITTTSMTVPAAAMPAGQRLYARVVVTLGDGSTVVTDNVFTTSDTTVSPASINWGPAGSSSVDVSKPFAWNADDIAQAYRLKILDGSSAVVADSGEIQVPRYFAESLPVGSYTARLGTEVGGAWTWTDAPFTVTSTGPSAANEVDAAHWAVDYVRHMADIDNSAYPWTEIAGALNTLTAAGNHPSPIALCADYSDELLRILKQMNIAPQLPANRQAKRFDTFFNYYDGHTMVQFWDSASSSWIVLDPTFDIAMKRASDGGWATIDDAHAATAAKNWAAIDYVALGDFGLGLPNRYYVDYPLLYLNPPGQSPWLDAAAYMTKLASMPTNQRATYTIAADQNPVTILVDGRSTSVPFSSTDPFGAMFQARTVALPSGSSANVSVYTPNWYVFTPPY